MRADASSRSNSKNLVRPRLISRTSLCARLLKFCLFVLGVLFLLLHPLVAHKDGDAIAKAALKNTLSAFVRALDVQDGNTLITLLGSLDGKEPITSLGSQDNKEKPVIALRSLDGEEPITSLRSLDGERKPVTSLGTLDAGGSITSLASQKGTEQTVLSLGSQDGKKPSRSLGSQEDKDKPVASLESQDGKTPSTSFGSQDDKEKLVVSLGSQDGKKPIAPLGPQNEKKPNRLGGDMVTTTNVVPNISILDDLVTIGSKNHYNISVQPSSKDGYHVLRRFSEFSGLHEQLSAKLGAKATSGFPGKTWRNGYGTLVDTRARGKELEAWLRRLSEQAKSGGPWTRLLRSFLNDESDQSDGVCHRKLRISMPGENDRIEEDGTHYFQVIVSSEDGQAPLQSWLRYSRFLALKTELGVQAHDLPNASFPEKRIHVDLDKRRRELETWLRAVLKHPDSQGPWRDPMSKFLDLEHAVPLMVASRANQDVQGDSAGQADSADEDVRKDSTGLGDHANKGSQADTAVKDRQGDNSGQADSAHEDVRKDIAGQDDSAGKDSQAGSANIDRQGDLAGAAYRANEDVQSDSAGQGDIASKDGQGDSAHKDRQGDSGGHADSGNKDSRADCVGAADDKDALTRSGGCSISELCFLFGPSSVLSAVNIYSAFFLYAEDVKHNRMVLIGIIVACVAMCVVSSSVKSVKDARVHLRVVLNVLYVLNVLLFGWLSES